MTRTEWVAAGVILLVVPATLWWFLPDPTWVTATAVGLAGVTAAGSWALFRALRPTLGTMTSSAALTLTWALIAGLVAFTSPSCPGGIEPVTCTPAQAGGWVLTGALLAVTFLITIGLPARALGATARLLRRGWDAYRSGRR